MGIFLLDEPAFVFNVYPSKPLLPNPDGPTAHPSGTQELRCLSSFSLVVIKSQPQKIQQRKFYETRR